MESLLIWRGGYNCISKEVNYEAASNCSLRQIAHSYPMNVIIIIVAANVDPQICFSYLVSFRVESSSILNIKYSVNVVTIAVSEFQEKANYKF